MAESKKGTKEKTGILMIGHGEPEVFDEEVWAEGLHEMFEEFRQTGLEVPPDDAFPMMLMEIKDKYEAMGGKSRHAEVCRKQCEMLSEDFPGYDVRIGFNEFIGPLFTDVAKKMVNDGINKIAFIPMLKTDSTHTGEVWNKIQTLELDKQGVKWVMGKPLFYRPEPTQFVINKLAETAGKTPLNRVGVVLASHGEPDEWTRLCLENTRCKEQETAFCACVKKGLIEKGFVWDNIVQGFNEFTHPEFVARRGCQEHAGLRVTCVQHARMRAICEPCGSWPSTAAGHSPVLRDLCGGSILQQPSASPNNLRGMAMRTTTKLLWGLILAGLAPSAGWATPPNFKTLAIGASAPDFNLPGVDGQDHCLSDFAASPVLMVIFTCNHCPTAQAYEQRIIQLHAQSGPRGVAVVAISPNDPHAVRLDELGYTDLSDSLEEMKIRAEHSNGFL